MELMNPKEARQISPLMLAYVGDSVIELKVRTRLLTEGCYRMNEVHRRAVSYVRAATQAKAYYKLETILSEEDLSIARRGRNAKSNHVRKNADMTEYHLATGFEAVVGYLYLIENKDLLEKVMNCLYQIIEGGEENANS